MAGLTGLTGIAGYQVQVNNDAQATPEQRSGGTADPKHSERGETALPYSWESKATQTGEHGPYGPENQLLGNENDFWMPGGEEWQDPTFDHTPNNHAAPWIVGASSGPVPGETPDQVAGYRIQSAWAHSVSTGAGLKSLTGLPALQDQWESPIDQTSPGHSDLRPLDKQALSSGFMWGTRDRTQSMARQNEYGFDSAHMFRRVATGSIPGNTMWLKPGGRPLAKSLPGPSRPAVGVDSPFSGQDLGRTFDINGAYLQNVPTEYEPPSQPNLAPSLAPNEAYAPVEWY